MISDDKPSTPDTVSTTPADTPGRGLPAMGDILKDSRFYMLPAVERHRFLSRNYPQYASLSPEEQHKFFMRNAVQHTDAEKMVGQQIWNAITGPVKFIGTVGRAIGYPIAPNEDDKSAARGELLQTGKNLITQPVRELWEGKQPSESVMTPASHPLMRPFNMLMSLMGGDPVEMRRATERGDSGSAMAAALTVPVLTAGLGKLFHATIPEREAATSTRQGLSALRSTLPASSGIVGEGPVTAAARTSRYQSLVQEAMRRRGITDKSLKDLLATADKNGTQGDIVGRVGRGNQLVLDLTDEAASAAHETADKIVQEYNRVPSRTVSQQIAGDLRAQIAEKAKVNPSLAGAMSRWVDRVSEAKTFGELNKLKSELNKLSSDMYKTNPGDAINSTAEAAEAYRTVANAIRDKMYPMLERMSGGKVKLVEAGIAEADAIAMRDAISDHYYRQVAPRQAAFAASGMLDYTFGTDAGPSHSLYTRHIIGRGAEKAGVVPTAGGKFNKVVRKGFEKSAGEGGEIPQARIKSPPRMDAMPAGASVPDKFAQAVIDKGLSPGGVFTDEGIRSHFDVPDRVSLRELKAVGVIEPAEGGGWRLGPSTQRALKNTKTHFNLPDDMPSGAYDPWEGKTRPSNSVDDAMDHAERLSKRIEKLEGYESSAGGGTAYTRDQLGRAKEAYRQLEMEIHNYHINNGTKFEMTKGKTPTRATPLRKTKATAGALGTATGTRLKPPPTADVNEQADDEEPQ